MSKENAKIVKVVSKKKVNKYTLADCDKEIARLENVSCKSAYIESKYYNDVKEQKFLLTHIFQETLYSHSMHSFYGKQD